MMLKRKQVKAGLGIAAVAAMLFVAPASRAQDQAAELTVNTLPVSAPAQTKPADTDNRAMLAIAETKSHVRDASVTPESVMTLFFTAWQFELLKEAKIGFKTALPAPGATASSSSGAPRDPGIREIALGGIAFKAPQRWTVWLNGVRITPDAIPTAVMDIKVSRSHIDLKWFDAYTNKIYPIRLRPQERFNLDSRIFLPGAGAM